MSRSPNDVRQAIAAFDFDGTLTTRDSVAGFARRIAALRLGRALGRGARHLPSLVGSAARQDRDHLRAVATRMVFTGAPYDAVTSQAKQYSSMLLKDRMRADVVERLRAHQADDAVTVIVSASYLEYLLPLAEHLEIDSVLATRLEVVDGYCTGELVDGNCRGPEKVRRLASWLDDRGLDRSQVEVWAYGDSSGDKEMLDWADHPRWVGRRANSL